MGHHVVRISDLVNVSNFQNDWPHELRLERSGSFHFNVGVHQEAQSIQTNFKF